MTQARVWMKSARLEWVQGNLDAARKLLQDGIALHSDEVKLWMMRGQIEEQSGNTELARDFYARGRKNCPQEVPIWVLSARLEVAQGNFTRARSLLEKGRTVIADCPELFVEGCRVEKGSGNAQAAKSLMAKAMQNPACRASGFVHSEAIFMEKKAARRTKSVDALKSCENDPLVLLSVARLFLSELKYKKARNWFHRCVKIDPDYGDAWASYYKFELQHGDEGKQEEVRKTTPPTFLHRERRPEGGGDVPGRGTTMRVLSKSVACGATLTYADVRNSAIPIYKYDDDVTGAEAVRQGRPKARRALAGGAKGGGELEAVDQRHLGAGSKELAGVCVTGKQPKQPKQSSSS